MFPEDTKYDKKMSREEWEEERHLNTKMLIDDDLYGEK